MSTFKNLTTSAFKDTIKMTLTTDGNMGVGNINPNYKITASGTIQGASNGTQVTINTVPLRVGLDTWKDNVHLSLGQIDLTNQGFIQVLVGAYNNGIDINGTGYGLSIQPSGGNVGIGQQAAGSKLQVNGTIRTDDDFVTGTDDPGWVYHPITAGEVLQSYLGNWGSPQRPSLVTAGSDFHKAHFTYKILGKTVFFWFRFTWGLSAWDLNSYGCQVLLPQLDFRDYNAGANNTQAGNGDSIAWVSSNSSMAMRSSVRKYVSPSTDAPAAFLNKWILVLDRIDGGSGQNFTNATFSGQFYAELN